MSESKFKFPTEEVELPSKGLLYPEGHPLKSGKIEMKYMTAKEEDILTNQNYIAKGIVLDKLLQALIITDVKLKDILIGDKNAILIASRILGYGKEYKFEYAGKEYTIDLTKVKNKPFDVKTLSDEGYGTFEMPSNGTVVEYKHLTEKDVDKITQEVLGISKISKGAAPEITTKLKHQIISVNGDNNKSEIRKYVDTFLLARDSRALRNHIRDTAPDVDLNYITDDGTEISIPITINFFWPDL